MNKITEAIMLISLVALTVIIGSYVWNLQTQGPTPPKPEPLEGFISFSTVSETQPDTLAANAGASSTYTIWHMKNPGVFPITSKDDLQRSAALSVSAAVSVGVGRDDNQQVGSGYKAFLVLQVYGGTGDYVRVSAMMAKHVNLIVNHQENIDLGTDGYPELLFLLDVTNVPLSKVAGQASPVALTGYLVVEDVTLADDNPADFEAAGTGAQSGSSVVKWEYTFSSDAEGDTVVVGRVYISYNRTDDYATAKKLSITAFDGAQTVINNPVTESRTSTSYDAYYFPASGVNYRWTYQGLIMTRSPGSNLFFAISWAFDYSFPTSNAASGNAVTVTVYVTTVQNEAGGGTTADNSDAVIIKNAT